MEILWSLLIPFKLLPLFLALYQPYFLIKEKSNSLGKSLNLNLKQQSKIYFFLSVQFFLIFVLRV